MNKKVSIVIPIYNADKYLNKTLENVVNQTFKDLEIICINDCSTDNSLNILNNFAIKDDRIKVLNNKKNIGAALTRNIGIDAAAGDYIYFLDADDYIDEKYIECMVQKIEQNNSDIVLNLSVLAEQNNKISQFHHLSLPKIDKGGKLFDKITTIHDTPCFIWARMYKKSFLNEHNLRFIDTHADDVVFNTITTIYTDKTFVFYGENYHYVIHNSGMVGRSEASNIKDLNHMKAYSLIYDFLKERNMLNDRLKLFRVYPFIKVDTEEKFEFYKKFFEKIEHDFQKNENIYNELEKFFVYSLLNSSNYEEYINNYNKVVTIGFLRRGTKK